MPTNSKVIVSEKTFFRLDIFTAVKVMLTAMAIVILIAAAIKLYKYLIKKYLSVEWVVPHTEPESDNQSDEDENEDEDEDEVEVENDKEEQDEKVEEDAV
ncbi:hypothetical protein TYRP_020100 [Tyrophagus putrescentiae]|nr:hypothetical protein TYRP_020100 [Tyrophagus putrescentiae]